MRNERTPEQDARERAWCEWRYSKEDRFFELTPRGGFDAGWNARSEENARTYEDGIRFACAMVDEMYAKSNTHDLMQGDCVLAKLNMLPKSKIRKNPYRAEEPKK